MRILAAGGKSEGNYDFDGSLNRPTLFVSPLSRGEQNIATAHLRRDSTCRPRSANSGLKLAISGPTGLPPPLLNQWFVIFPVLFHSIFNTGFGRGQ